MPPPKLQKISIITPSFNQGKYIEETIQSVLNQNYPNLEYIVIDGGSTDNSVEIIKKYSKHLAYWVTEPDRGQSHAINKGLDKCTGEIFNWLNSDDFLEPGTLLKVAEIFNDSSAYLVAGKCRKFGKGFDEKLIPENPDEFADLENKLLGINFLQPSTFLHFNAIRNIGFPSTSLHYCMDYEWYLRFLLFFGIEKCYETDLVLSHARLHTESKTLSVIEKFRTDRNSILFQLSKQLELATPLLDQISSLGMLKNYEQKWEININFDKNKFSDLLAKEITPYITDPSYIYRTTADYMSYFGNNKHSLNAAIKAIRRSPLKLINYKYFGKSLKSLLLKTK